MTGQIFERITIIGLGLIGSSIARAARAHHLSDTIVGCDTNEITLTYARAHKFIDVPISDLRTAIRASQLVILATPPSTLGQMIKTLAPALKPGMIIMDTSSVKEAVITAMAPHIPEGIDFIPAHPIAGSEQSGVAAGSADLFQHKRIIVTPVEPMQTTALKTVTSFWRGMGAYVEAMPPHLHDLIYAHVSHLPQLLATAAEGVLKGHTPSPGNNLILDRFLRIARSNASLWVDILALNKDNVLRALDRYLDVVVHVRSELRQAPEGSLQKPDEKLTYGTLFPRVAASCLVTTVMEAGQQLGISFARYAGTGFADFTAPVTLPPEEDIERIASQHDLVSTALSQFQEKLQSFRSMINANDWQSLREAME